MELSTKTPRIEVVDALRGFAVMAILLVHNLEHFIFPVYPESLLNGSPFWMPEYLMRHFHCLPESLMPYSLCFSDSLSISSRTTSS